MLPIGALDPAKIKHIAKAYVYFTTAIVLLVQF